MACRHAESTRESCTIALLAGCPPSSNTIPRIVRARAPGAGAGSWPATAAVPPTTIAAASQVTRSRSNLSRCEINTLPSLEDLNRAGRRRQPLQQRFGGAVSSRALRNGDEKIPPGRQSDELV